MVRTLAPWLVFPVIMGGSIAAAIALMPTYGPASAVVLAQTGSFLLVTLCELFLPHRRKWLRSQGDLRTDILHAIVTGLGTTQVGRPLVYLLGAGIAAWLSATLGSALWPTTWPLGLQLCVA